MDFIEIYKKLDFLEESIRLQYSNFLFRNLSKVEKKISFDEIVERLKTEEPIEYILNFSEFYGLDFFVDKRVLIPRHETERLVQNALDTILNEPQDYIIIDVGTGSGCIILSLAYLVKSLKNPNLNKVKFIGIEKSEAALEVAKINRAKLDLENDVELHAIDFRDFQFERYENLIVLANLPYIPDSRKLQPSVANFEPKEALFGGDNGDELIQELINKVRTLPSLKLFSIEKDQGVIEQIFPKD